MNYAFEVEEVKREGYIAWDAIEKGTGHRITLRGPIVAGSYPEIAHHLTQVHDLNLVAGLNYDDRLGDRLVGQTWTFKRGADEVVVKDIPRAIFRLGGLTP
jgi:hypothetical protein